MMNSVDEGLGSIVIKTRSRVGGSEIRRINKNKTKAYISMCASTNRGEVGAIITKSRGAVCSI